MKKGMLLFSIITLVFLLSFIIAQEACEEGDTSCKINNGYLCLNEKIDNKGCSSMSAEEKVFAALATGDCRSDLTSDPKFKSDVKYTAQAVLALGGNQEGEEWLLETAKGKPSQIDWFLQIDSTLEEGETATCTVSDGSQERVVTINNEKRLSGNLPSCLSFSTGNYWLEVSQACYGKEFEISCDKGFSTNLLYKKDTADTIYVAEDTSSEAAEGITHEQVNSSCFKQGSACNYEGSLWASLVLGSPKFGYDISEYLPYLLTLADEEANQKFLPEAFLYHITDDFETELLQKQKAEKWWAQSGDKFYDTALALYSLQYIEPLEKQNSIDWLMNEAQDNNGCWNNGNMRDTAFILYSIEPRATSPGGGGSTSCSGAGYYCMSGISCSESGGEVLSEYSCSGISTFICCSEQKVVETCEEQGGSVCNSNQECVGGVELDASDLGTGQACCSQGTCEVPSDDIDECSSSGGTCRISGCFEDEEESFEQCEFSSDICCMQKDDKGGFGVVWIVILLLLIGLTIFGIIYREKLRKLWFKFKSKVLSSFNKGSRGGPSGPGPRGPPRRPPFLPPPGARRPTPGRVIPGPMQASSPRRIAAVRPGKDVDDVLKKLKEMGK